ncbi:hypothetical Protein YC6258_01113 [Gynuella sunshinyii YC6258]|uniref:Uncharacterized protein n=1 Tax=Gynuella sunshinyii YC6258 TaxID=1445510 RepID=A0A0C5VG41_9GAMM|nr:hypothetical Protein YC6258_01113 [Gynuella sunshinyii YC6258]
MTIGKNDITSCSQTLLGIYTCSHLRNGSNKPKKPLNLKNSQKVMIETIYKNQYRKINRKNKNICNKVIMR